MPLDNAGNGAAEDDAANAAEATAQQPAAAPAPSFRDKIAQAEQAGYSNDDIVGYLGQSKTFAPKLDAARQAGYSETEIFSHLGLKPMLPAPTSGVGSLDPEGASSPIGSRIGAAAEKGMVEGYGEPTPSVLSDSAQAKLDAIQRAGGWKGTAAQLASTLGTDVGTVLHVLPGLFNAGMGAYQGAARQAGVEAGHPGAGEAAANAPGEFMEAFPQESMGMRGVLDRGARIEAPAAMTARTMRSPSDSDLAGAAQRAQAGPRIFDVDDLAQRHPAAPGTPMAIQQDIQNAKDDVAATRAAKPAQAPPSPVITPEQRAAEEERQAASQPAAPPPGPMPVSTPAPTTTPQAPGSGLSRTMPEPAQDIAAQIEAMTSGQSTRDAVFVSPGTPMPPQLPQGVQAIPRPEGTLLTTNPAKAHIFQTVPLNDDVMAHLLGYPETKTQAMASGDPQAVQAVDDKGRVQSEMAVSPQGVPAAAKVAAEQAPGSTIEVKPPQEALANRQGQPGQQAPGSDFVMMRPADLKVDPERFQYKESGDKGVTGALQGVTRWEPALANPITAWQDAAGDTYVVNGHQRHDLATRAEAAGQTDVMMPTRIFREEDGYTPDFMKVLGAYQNIAEGSGTAVDAAKVMRGQNAIPSEMVLPQLPPKSEMVKQAQALSKLSPDAFGIVENGIVSPAYAAHVGDLIADPKEQTAALGLLAKAEPANSNQARLMVQDIRNSGFLQGTQQGLFGDEDFAKSIFPERMKVLDGAMSALRRNRGLFRAAVEGEQELTAAGNQLSTEANINARSSNDQLTDILQRQATTRGPISDALTAAANDLASGKPRAGVQAAFLAAVRKIVERGEATGIQPSSLPDGERPPGEETPEPVEDQGASLFQPRRLPQPPGNGPDLFGADRTPAPRAAPEPTIKNDQRQQEMPGMAPSAVQAQKAFDAKGPKTGQLPPDEGLFSRPETPQPPLTMQRNATSRFAAAGTKTFVDKLPTLPESIRMGGNEAAAKWVADQGRQTGYEHMAIVDNKTGEIVHAGTNGKGESLAFDIGGRDMSPENSYTVHHNHPQSSAFSGPDIGMLAWPGMSDLTAIGHDGTIFTASMTDKLRDAGIRQYDQAAFSRSYNRLSRLFDQVNKQVSDVVERLLWQGKLPPDANLHQLIYDGTSALLHRGNVINLTTTRELPKVVSDAIERAFPGGVDTRPVPNAVQPEAGLSGLRGGVPEGSGNPRPASMAVENRTAQSPAVSSGARRDAQGPPRQGQLIESGTGFAAPPQRGLNLPNTPQFEVLRDKAGLDKAIAEIKSVLSPTSLRGAAPTEAVMRKYGSEKAQSYAQSFDALQKVRDAVDALPAAAQRDFTDRMEKGQPQANPALDAVATTLRQQLDGWAQKVQGLGRGYLQNAIEDYMGHVWGNYPEYRAKQQAQFTQAQMMDRARGQAGAKTPLAGSGAFLKQRTFPTQADGIAQGLIPVTNNPVDMQLLKLREMQKYYHGIKLADTMKQTGIARWVPAGQERDAFNAGLDKLNDRVFQPRLTGDANPAGFGRLEPGNWYAPEPAARLFNNHMSQGLMGNSIVNGFRALGNALNMTQLGLSGFHATFVTLDTMLSRTAIGLQQIMGGDFLKGAKSISVGATPYAAIDTIRQGSKLRAAWLDPAQATPEWKALADRLNEGGGRISMDQFYRSNASGPLLHSLKDLSNPSSIFGRAMQTFSDEPTAVRKIIAAPVKLAGRVLETATEPLMGAMVPRAKLGVFAQMARDWQERNPQATPEERSAAMIKAWDSVDNRLGQLVYDNLFWKKAQKDIAFLSTRSVGWNIGTIRELGGGVVDGVKLLNDVANRRPPQFTARMAYTIALPVMTALMGSMMNYLMTGKPPDSVMDAYFPQTGKQTPDGQPERLSLPGYMKDVMDYAKAPLQTMSNKTNPLIETLLELHKNQDYYGGIIYDPQRDAAGPAYGDYLLNQVLPFSVRGSNRVGAEGGSKMDQALSFWGFQPAPKSITNPERGEAFQQRANTKAYKTRAREQGRVAPLSKAWNYITGEQSP